MTDEYTAIRKMIREEVFFALLDVYEALHQVVRDHKPYSSEPHTAWMDYSRGDK